MNHYTLEIVARERHNDLLRAAEQHRLAKALQTNRTARRPPVRASLGAIFIAVGQRLKMLANAG
jgi:hypothetical protein